MASLEDHEKANGAKLSRLLIDTGTEAMRNVFDSFHPPATLTATLNSKRHFLQNLPFINRSQMDILFPPSGVPSQSKDFDITLLFILLRNICGLRPPASTGKWDDNPPSTDTSTEANLARIKYYRNKVYGHINTTGVDDANFRSCWNEISAAVVGLGTSMGCVNSLKLAPLDENLYLAQLREWKENEDKLEVMFQESERNQKIMNTTLKELSIGQKKSLHNQQALLQNMKSVLKQEEEAKTTLNSLSKQIEAPRETNVTAYDLGKENTNFPKPCLPDKVPNFTGREAECKEIIDAMTSESVRTFSIWGPPGFGKTSVAKEVSHRLNFSESPAYFVNLRGKRSEKDLVSSLLGIFGSAASCSNLSPADELYRQLLAFTLFLIILMTFCSVTRQTLNVSQQTQRTKFSIY